MSLLNIRDPAEAFPDHSAKAEEKVGVHRQRLIKGGVTFDEIPMALLATEDEILDVVDHVLQKKRGRNSCS